MRINSIIIVLAILLTVGGGAFLVARKYGIGIELTRNLEANRRAQALQAQETLQTLATNPKLTVVRQQSQKGAGKRNPVVLCVLSRHVLGMLVKPADSAHVANRPLLERLGSVDVEPVPYDKGELPALIAEIASVRGDNPSSALAGDLSKLLASLREENVPGTEVVFY